MSVNKPFVCYVDIVLENSGSVVNAYIVHMITHKGILDSGKEVKESETKN